MTEEGKEVLPCSPPKTLPLHDIGANGAEEAGCRKSDLDTIAAPSEPSADASIKPCGLIFKSLEPIPSVLRRVLLEKGWTAWVEGEHAEDEWHLQWRGTRFKPSEYKSALRNQKMNHYPKSGIITMKDSLLRTLRKMRAVHGAIYGFHPDGFILPTEYTKFIAAWTQSQQQRQGKDGETDMWIVKPHDLSRGRKIFVMRRLDELCYDQQSIIQRYISQPLTIGGYKLDLRLYVVVPSVHPLQVWLYDEGLVRFASAKYDTARHGDPFSHLTNSSINKTSPSAGFDKEEVGSGCKWMLSRLKTWVQSTAGAATWDLLWGRIINIVNLTCLLLAPVVPFSNSSSFFELFGFDIMVDDTFEAHLLEVNCSPALGMDEPTDVHVKVPLLRDLLDLLHIEASPEPPPPPRRRSTNNRRKPPTSSTHTHTHSNVDSNGSSTHGDQSASTCARCGGFEMIFPFDECTRELSEKLSDQARGSHEADASAVRTQECSRAIIGRIRVREKAMKEAAALAIAQERTINKHSSEHVALDSNVLDSSHSNGAALAIAQERTSNNHSIHTKSDVLNDSQSNGKSDLHNSHSLHGSLHVSSVCVSDGNGAVGSGLDAVRQRRQSNTCMDSKVPVPSDNISKSISTVGGSEISSSVVTERRSSLNSIEELAST